MSTLDKAIHIAAQAHAGQKDQNGKPYILHPIRLMLNVDSDEEKVVAILHDVVEYSEWTLDGLREEGFSDEIITAVDCITRRDNEPYMNYIERLRSNRIARKVKLADLEDNMDLRRIDQVANHDVERLKRNHFAWKKLMEHELKFKITNKIQ